MPLAAAEQDRLWNDEDAFATSLLVLFLDQYGTEGLSWHPETIVRELQDDLGRPPDDICRDKLMIAINLVTTDEFYTRLPDFVEACNVLAGDVHDPRLWDPADLEEISWGMSEAMLLAPPETEEPFNEDIRSYIGQMLDASGIINPPDVLAVALRKPPDISAEFSDDPEMFSAIYDLEQAKTEAIDNFVRKRIHQLIRQLSGLELKSGDTSQLRERLRRGLADSRQ